MRWFVVRVSEHTPPIGRPYVAAELDHRGLADSAAQQILGGTVLADDEMEADPDLSLALAAWRAGDDSVSTYTEDDYRLGRPSGDSAMMRRINRQLWREADDDPGA